LVHLQNLEVALRGPAKPSYVGVDLIDEEGMLIALEAKESDVRRVLDSTCTSMVRLVSDAPECPELALMGGWPHPFRSGRLLLHAVQASEEVVLNVRVSLGRIPQRALAGTTNFVNVSPWVQVLGPVRDACGPFQVEFRKGARSTELLAGSVPLPPNCSLVSPPEQVLFMLEPLDQNATLV
jgi:hypothetical protein